MKLVITISILSFALSINKSIDQPASIKVFAGTPVYLSPDEEISSEEVEVGFTVELLVDSDVIIGGEKVIANGGIAEGRITKVIKSCGIRCHLSCPEVKIQAETAQAADGQRIYLRSRSHNC